MTAEIEEEIVTGLLLAANIDDKYEDKSNLVTRIRAVSNAVELMLAHLGDNIPIWVFRGALWTVHLQNNSASGQRDIITDFD